MRQNLIVLFLTLQFITVHSQNKDEFGFDFEIRKGTAVLVPSWNNIFSTITMPNSVFSELMDKYGYIFIPEKNYWWKVAELDDSDFFIEKTKHSISFIWSNTYMETKELKEKFRKYFSEKMANGMEIYLVKLGQNIPMELQIWEYQNKGLVSFEMKL